VIYIKITVFWDVTPYSLVDGRHHIYRTTWNLNFKLKHTQGCSRALLNWKIFLSQASRNFKKSITLMKNKSNGLQLCNLTYL